MRVLALFVLFAASASAAVPFKSTRPLTGMRASAFRPQSNCFTQCPQLCPNKITAANAAVCTDINDWYSTTISSLQQTAKLPASCASLASQLLCPVLYGASDYYNNVINCDAEKSKDVPARLCQSACQDAVQQLTQCAQAAGGSDFKPTFLSVLLSCDSVSVHSSDCMSAQGIYVPPADDSNDDSMSSSSTTGIVLGVALCLFLIAAAVVICYNRYKGRPFWHREGSAALQLRERQHAETAEPEVIGGGTYMNGHSGTAIVLNDDDAFRERPPLPPGPPPEHVVERTLAREREDASLLNS